MRGDSPTVTSPPTFPFARRPASPDCADAKPLRRGITRKKSTLRCWANSADRRSRKSTVLIDDLHQFGQGGIRFVVAHLAGSSGFMAATTIFEHQRANVGFR